MDFDAGSFVFDERKLYNKIGKFINTNNLIVTLFIIE